MNTITFFSYKGGSGRSTLLYNTLPLLANALNATTDNPIVVVDLDIDSRGLSFLFNCGNTTTEYLTSTLLLNNSGANLPKDGQTIISKAKPIGQDLGLSDNGSVVFIPASKNSSAELNNVIDGKGMAEGLRKARKTLLNYGCKALIFDAPSGYQMAADAALSVSNKIVNVLRITRQFREGTRIFWQEKGTRFEDKEIILVPNAVPKEDTVSIYSVSTLLKKIEEIKNFIYDGNKVNTTFLDEFKGINEVALFKLKEENLYFNEKENVFLQEDEKAALKAYERLALELK